MDFTLTCDCGKQINVTEAAAGREIDCECGRTTKAPSFRQMREMAGMPAINIGPALIISHLIEKGELFPPFNCVWCDVESDDVLHLQVECEREWVKAGGFRWGVFLASMLMPIRVFSWEEGESHGKDLIFHLPVTVCQNCRERLKPKAKRNLFLIGLCTLLPIGLGTLFYWPAMGTAFLAGFVVTWLVVRIRRKKRLDPLKTTLRQVPLYAELLERYPDALVTVYRG